MRGSVVLLAVFAVTSCSVGVNDAHFVKSGKTGHGNARGNDDAPGIEEGAFGNGENDGHRIGKRSSLDHGVAKQAAIRSAVARRQLTRDPDALFPIPILPAQFDGSIPLSSPEQIPPPDPISTDPSIPQMPPLLTKPWNYPPLVKSRDLSFRRAMPSVSEREARSSPAMNFLPLSQVEDEAMKIIASALPHSHILPVMLPKSSTKRSFARSQDFDRSDLKNRRGRSGLRGYSPLRSYPTPPGPPTEGVITLPLYKPARNTAPARLRAEENFRREVRSAVVNYLVQLWNKISKWFMPDSNSGGGLGGGPSEGEIPVGGEEEVGSGFSEGHQVNTERPPEAYDDDGVIEHVRPPVDYDGTQVIHLSGEDASETAEDSTEEDETDVDYETMYSIIQPGSNWEVRRSKRMWDDYKPMYSVMMPGPNWEAHRARGKEDVASKIKDSSAGTRRQNSDDSGTRTDIFG